MKHTTDSSGSYLPGISIALVSASSLAYEILLTRLFSIVQWHHFAYMAISIALLGFAASGTFLALNTRLLDRYPAVYVINLTLFGLLALPSYLLAQAFAINPERLLWEPLQMLRMTAIYLVLSLPFFFTANALGLSIMRFRKREPQVYAADLFGAGLGSIAIIGLLYLVFPMDALKILTISGLTAAIIGAFEVRTPRIIGFIVIALLSGITLALALMPSAWLNLSISPYKSLPQQLNVIDTTLDTERSSPLGLISVVASPSVPFRHAPGLSLNAIDDIPEQRGVFIDGDALTPIDRGNENDRFGYLDALTSALPYHISKPNQVVVLGAGGGSLVRQALFHRAAGVTAVELNPELVELVRLDYGDFSGGLFDLANVDVKIEEGRGFLGRTTELFDLIQLELMDSFAASSAGLHALGENYLYTVEAFDEYYDSLNANGILAINRWVKLPLRDSLKIFATAVETLHRAGVSNPAASLLMIRGWQISTLLVKKGRFTSEQIAATKHFCEARSFDLAFYESMPESLANQYNIFSEPYLYRGTQALAGGSAEEFSKNYKFNIQPATDDRPYFSYFFKWRTLPEIVSLLRRGGVPLLESGYLILIATLVQTVFISIVLIVLPVWNRMRNAAVRRSVMSMYFIALGFSFFFVEIVFIQKFLLFLHRPVLSVAAALSGFLVFAGIGSFLAGRLQHQFNPHGLVVVATTSIGILGLLYAFLLPSAVFAPLAGVSMPIKLLVSVLLIGLLAIPMGMPFPLGLARLREHSPKLIPIAWAINGCASVISAVLATLLAIHFGFTFVLLIALILYISAAATFVF